VSAKFRTRSRLAWFPDAKLPGSRFIFVVLPSCRLIESVIMTGEQGRYSTLILSRRLLISLVTGTLDEVTWAPGERAGIAGSTWNPQIEASPLLESGLLGPVSIVPGRRVRL
jgi:hypothetical protein